ncbi:MAG: hypothetical protein PHD39_09690 [Methylobacter tundripaludum]|nr:hypothetical protein [Methylobacter tundripaludum]
MSARTPKTRHSGMDGNLAAIPVLDQREIAVDSFTSMCSGFRQSLPE